MGGTASTPVRDVHVLVRHLRGQRGRAEHPARPAGHVGDAPTASGRLLVQLRRRARDRGAARGSLRAPSLVHLRAAPVRGRIAVVRDGSHRWFAPRWSVSPGFGSRGDGAAGPRSRHCEFSTGGAAAGVLAVRRYGRDGDRRRPGAGGSIPQAEYLGARLAPDLPG